MKICSLFLILLLNVSLVGCAQPPAPANTLKVGVIAGQHAEIIAVVKEVAAKQGLNLEIIEFTDYLKLNDALGQGIIDINSFQSQSYLDTVNASQSLTLKSVAKTIVKPLGFYSKVYRSISQIPPGTTITIPADPVNQDRALRLLAKAGLITLNHNADSQAILVDIANNPKRLKFRELDAKATATALATCDLVAINSSYAFKAGFIPTENALLLEDAASQATNILAVRASDTANPLINTFITAYQSPGVKSFITTTYHGTVLPAW
ncbi:MAG: metQ 4 [Firmicutes bacterium]|nr:metQ 4 [Bacillota bacterium]